MSCLRMLCFGDNENHQLGVHTSTDFDRRNAILSAMHLSSLRMAGSQLIEHDHNSFWTPEEQEKCKVHVINTTRVFNGQTIRKVICANKRTFFITDSYKVYGCGLNDFNVLPVSSSIANTSEIIANHESSNSTTTPNQSNTIGNTSHINLHQTKKRKKHITKPTLCDLLKEDIVDISCGIFYNIFICRRSRAMYACGNNSFGQCSLPIEEGLQKSNRIPQLVDLSLLKPTSKEIVQVSCGFNHTLLLTNDRRVYVTGSAENGKLGFDPTDNSIQDILVDGVVSNFNLLACKKLDSKTVQVETGTNWSLFLTQEGHVYFCGQSKLFIDQVYVPTIVTTVKPVSKIASGNYHGFFVFREGQSECGLAGFGRFIEGQLGQRIPITRDKIDGTSLKDVNLPGELALAFETISIGDFHAVCTTTMNEVFVTGSNLFNQLGFYEDTSMRETNLSEPVVTCFTKLPRHYTYQDLNISKNFRTRVSCGDNHTFIYFISENNNSVMAQFTMGLLSSSAFQDIALVCSRKTSTYDEVYPSTRLPHEGPTKKKKL
ncbi:hypothetical protein FDP41_007622 [Naegleria fowleri]|uniref:Uncharacterized protein n=1 Tax=Naegleria fowleri TaxID=5763 RepID=A0A6A5C2X3_NAEFO|nr:uncharacterized protein FDP41_007622 [Naegleria fowleri]KAF0983707.1 hypothetical protein FDP41_007622 [Naegleria fowleri]CAG4710882.1 unnamed protein product [Naegleria fowleri]